MNYLVKGAETEKRLMLLLSLTSIRSEPIINAMKYHYVNGIDERTVIQFQGVTQSNFNRACGNLNNVAGIVERIKEHDWVKFINQNSGIK